MIDDTKELTFGDMISEAQKQRWANKSPEERK